MPDGRERGAAPARVRARVVSRRGVLTGGAGLAGAALAGGTGLFAGLAGCDGEGAPKGDADRELTMDPVTPNDEFYVTSCCGTPTVDAATWALVVRDRGVEVARVDLAALEALPPRDKEHTLECIGANAYNHAIDNAVWTGAPLAELFGALGVAVPAEIVELLFASADDYTTSVPVADLARAWIVWRMNGEPLPPEHGFPARLLVPGRYGMKNPKWLVGINLVDAPALGFWEERGWSNDATYRPNALVHEPYWFGATVEAGPVRVLGTAFAGEDPVVRVEVRVDEGAWSDAAIDYAPGADIWTLWHADLELSPGTHVVQARCTTASGAASAADPDGTDPLGGYDGSMALEIEAV